MPIRVAKGQRAIRGEIVADRLSSGALGPRKTPSFTGRKLHLVAKHRLKTLSIPEQVGLPSENNLRGLRRVLPTIERDALCGDKANCDESLKTPRQG